MVAIVLIKQPWVMVMSGRFEFRLAHSVRKLMSIGRHQAFMYEYALFHIGMVRDLLK